MDIENEKIIELMRANGISKDTAKILLALQTTSDLTQDDLTNRTKIAQPNVSIALSSAYNRKWVSLKINRNPDTKRARYCYSLAKSIREIIDDIADERAQEIARMMADLKALKAAI